MTIVRRYSDKPIKRKSKGYTTLTSPKYERFRKYRTIDKKPPIINPVNKNPKSKKRPAVGWNKKGSVISKSFVYDGEKTFSQISSDLNSIGLISDYKKDIEYSLNYYIKNYIENFRNNGYPLPFIDWLNSLLKDDFQTKLNENTLCNYNESHIYDGVGIPGRFCIGIEPNGIERDIGVSLWIK